jgi:Tol biopolymer transport system component
MPRARSARCLLLALIGIISLTLFDCGQGEDLAGPEPATLQVTTQTSGTGTDPDGYTVSIDGRHPLPIALVDTLVENAVTPGQHTVELGGVAPGCAVEGGTFRSVTAASGTTASDSFLVSCPDPETPVGTLLVSVTTSGVDLDPDGYVVAADPSIRRAVGSSDQVRLEGVPAGRQSIRLSGLAANCSVQGENPVTVDVTPGGEADTAFVVRCWPPPSGRIAFVTSSSVIILTPGGIPLDTFALESAGRPSWSPDGQFIALVEGDRSSVLVQRLSGGAAVELPGCLPSGNRPVWSPDGSRLLCLSQEGRLSSVQRDGSNPRDLSPQTGTRVISAQYLSDARIFFFAEVQGEGFVAFRVTADGTGRSRLFALPAEEIMVSEGTVVPSPDGQSVAYVGGLSVGGQLIVTRIDGTNARAITSLTFGVNDQTAPVWAPDASRIAFLAGQFSLHTDEVWLVNPDGTNLTRAPLPQPELLGAGIPDWSPDGTRLAFDFAPSADLLSDVYTIRADGSGLQRLTASGQGREPAWGP